MDQKDRMKMIGGSDIAAVMGVSRWKTPLALWAEKSGEVEAEDISGKEYVQLGTELEDFVAKKFERESGLKVRRDTRTFTYNADYPYMVAHIDRRIQGTDELLECKTCSAWKAKEWEGEEIPVEYILQVMWYLGITGMKKGYIAVLIGGQSFKWKEIDFDQDLFDKMVKAAADFMNAVANKQAPIAITGDKEILGQLYHGEGGELELEDNAVEGVVEALEERAALKRTVAEAYDRIEEIENQIKQDMGENDKCQAGLYKISWKSQTTKRLDTAKIKEAGIYDEYCKESVSRVFRVSKKKEKKS